MFNQNGIKRVSGAAPTQILFNVQNQMSVSVMISNNATGYVTENGRKILKAGTPLSGNLQVRSNAFVTSDQDHPAVGVLLHDVEITERGANGSLLIWGFVNLDRLSEETRALITDNVEIALNGKIWFLTD